MIGAREVALMEKVRGACMHASRSAALAQIGSIPESRNRKRSDLGILLVSHEDKPYDDKPSRRRDLPELDAA